MSTADKYACLDFRLPPRWGKRMQIAGAVAGWFYRKAQENARAAGTYQAARNLRKQGVPIEYALTILTGRTT